MLKLKLKVRRLIVLDAVLSLICTSKFIILHFVLVVEYCSHIGASFIITCTFTFTIICFTDGKLGSVYRLMHTAKCPRRPQSSSTWYLAGTNWNNIQTVMAVYCQFFVLCVSAWFTELKYLILALMNNIFPVTRIYWLYNFIRGICVCSNNTFMYSVVCLHSYNLTTYAKNCKCVSYPINTLA
jgi:hypothetical protein